MKNNKAQNHITKAKKDNGSLMLATLILVLVGCVGLGVAGALQKKHAAPPTPTPTPTQAIPADFQYASQPSLGDPKAPVKIVEFGDYKCPACGKWFKSEYPKVKANLVSTGKAQFFFVNMPFIGADSNDAALFQETVFHELGADAFWKLHDAIYANQKDETTKWITANFLEDQLSKISPKDGASKVLAAYRDKKYISEVQNDLNAAKQIGVNSTPSIFVNGQFVAQPDYASIERLTNASVGGQAK